MHYTLQNLTLFFFVYAFLGWIIETVYASIHYRRFVNRGFTSTPFCFLYGAIATTIAFMFYELKNELILLFLGSFLIGTLIQWLSGLYLEHIGVGKWWDYSERFLNINGYTCFYVSALFGLLGIGSICFLNDRLISLYALLPPLVGQIILLACLFFGGLDVFLTWMVYNHKRYHLGRLVSWNDHIAIRTQQLSQKITTIVEKRLERSYPHAHTIESEQRLSLEEMFYLFLIGAVGGDIVETIWVYLTTQKLMSRSSLVWGPFSVVWGLAISLATAMLYRDRHREDGYIFLVGTFLGGAYEYLCSVFTEVVFGKVFWDYSHFAFNIGGRINLLFCFFWGIAAVVWIKKLYPLLEKRLQVFMKKTGKAFTSALVVFMLLNITMSMLALIRYDQRGQGKEATSFVSQYLDEHYPDSRMEYIYPNAKER